MELGKRGEILPLTSLRFFAASLVFWEHVPMLPGMEWMKPPQGVGGKMGVTIFFVLSGFIIAYSYWEKDWGKRFGSTMKDFYWSRFARIYPLHWLVFALALPLGLKSNTAHVSTSDFPWLLTLTDKLWPGHFFGWQPAKVAWTLSCEFLFYLISPFVLWVLAKSGKTFLTAASILLAYTTAVLAADHWLPTGNWDAYLRAPEFLLGMTGFFVVHKINLKPSAPVLLLIGLAFLVAGAIGDVTSHWHYYNLGYAPGALFLIMGIWGTQGTVKSFLSRPTLVLLGHASFALYLLHDPFLRYLKVILNRLGLTIPAVAAIPVALAAFVAINLFAIVCFRHYENPIRLKLRNLVRRREYPKIAPAEVPCETVG